MKFRGRLLVVSLVVAAVASVAIGWVIARSGGSDGTTTAPEAVITGPSGTFEPPSIATNAKVEGTPLPEANVRTLNNDAFAVADLLGQPLVINIWGSTCGPCKKELPDFAEAHAEFVQPVISSLVGLAWHRGLTAHDAAYHPTRLGLRNQRPAVHLTSNGAQRWAAEGFRARATRTAPAGCRQDRLGSA